MRILYSKSKVETCCKDSRQAKKFFGGNDVLATSLLSRINALEVASVLEEIILLPTFRFHKLEGKMDGFFAIDIKSRKEPWRLIIQPLDEEEKSYSPCHIDKIASSVRIIRVVEVSKHYEDLH